MKLRRAACDPRLVVPEMGQPGTKIEAFESLVQELVAGEHKALVFSQFTDCLAQLAERLQARGVAFQYLDGATPAAERSKRLEAFLQGQGEVFVTGVKAGGFGLNLTAADRVINVDPWWNPAAEDQASGRAHRVGQQRPVTVYRLVTLGSIEERILAMRHDKRKQAKSMLNDPDGSAVLDAQALAELLRD
jgi:SNF2 family DNA or RNA helicase